MILLPALPIDVTPTSSEGLRLMRRGCKSRVSSHRCDVKGSAVKLADTSEALVWNEKDVILRRRIHAVLGGVNQSLADSL